ncbi:hypothetical protein SDC9_105742 [bioreactor metagenome]|uniref:Uncharacterized protein n=1 Tax=bioreactor metagenome TaxID=1076179 RepID=A0A645B0H8_9ZZZZ
MDPVGQFHRPRRFVALKMADEVPFDIAGQLRPFELQFLNFILPEAAQPGSVGLADGRRRKGFADRQQPHTFRAPSRRQRGAGDFLPYGLQALRKGLHHVITLRANGI